LQTITRTWLFQVLAGVGTDTLPQSPISLSVLGDLTVGGDITLGGDLIGFPELASSDPAKVSLTTVGNVTTLGVEKTVPEFARLTADSAAVNNSTVLVDATGLAVPVAANAVYFVEALIFFTSSDVADFQLGWSTPAGVSGRWGSRAAQVLTNPASTAAVHFVDTDWTGARPAGGATGVNVHFAPRGLLVTGGTAGTLQARFAQNTAEVSNTFIRAHSALCVQRVA